MTTATSEAVSSVRKLLNNNATADRLGISRRTLPVWRVNGKSPPFIKVGKSVRYDPVTVDMWLEANQHRHTGHSRAMTY